MSPWSYARGPAANPLARPGAALSLSARGEDDAQSGNDGSYAGDGGNGHVMLFLGIDVNGANIQHPLVFGETDVLNDQPSDSQHDEYNADPHQIAHLEESLLLPRGRNVSSSLRFRPARPTFRCNR